MYIPLFHPSSFFSGIRYHVSVTSVYARVANVCYLLGGFPWFRDAWEKHKDLDRYEAKWLYVDALMKVTSQRGVCFSIFDEATG